MNSDPRAAALADAAAPTNPPVERSGPEPNTRTASTGGLAVLLALIAGYVDCYSIATYAVFTSFMSGNSTQAGWNAGAGRFAEAGLCLLPIPCFVLGVFVATVAWLGGRPRLPGSLYAVVALLVLAGMAAGAMAPTAAWLGIVPLSLAMGIMNTAVTHVGAQSVSLGFVTGDLNNVGRNLALAAHGAPVASAQAGAQEGAQVGALGVARKTADSHVRRALVLALIWGSFFGGALLAGTAVRFGSWVLLPPAVILAGLAVRWLADPREAAA